MQVRRIGVKSERVSGNLNTSSFHLCLKVRTIFVDQHKIVKWTKIYNNISSRLMTIDMEYTSTKYICILAVHLPGEKSIYQRFWYYVSFK